MQSFEALKTAAMAPFAEKPPRPWDIYAYAAYRAHLKDPVPVAKGYAAAAQLELPDAYVYDDDLIAGSIREAYLVLAKLSLYAVQQSPVT